MRLPNAAVRALSIAGLLAFWAAAAALNGDPRVLPGPGTVLPRIWTELIHGDLLFQLQATLLRVAAAFVLAMSIGTVLGLVMGRRPGIDRWLDPWLVVFLNLPALVVIVLCYLWIGLNEVALGACYPPRILRLVTRRVPPHTRGVAEVGFDSALAAVDTLLARVANLRLADQPETERMRWGSTRSCWSRTRMTRGCTEP